MLVKIPDTHLVRDTNSMALLNTDRSAKEEYYAKVRMVKSQKEDINMVNNRIDSLQSELGEIKTLLKQLLAK